MKNFLLILFFISSFGFCSDVYVYAGLNNSAYITYEALFTEKQSGIYSKDGFVFFVADIKISGKRVAQQVYEAKAMIRINQLVKKFFTEDILVEKLGVEKLGEVIRNKVAKLISTDNVYDFNIADLRGQVLVNDPQKKDGKRYYRYVFSVTDDEVNKKKNELSSIKIDINFLVHRIFQEALLNDQYQDLVSFYLELGLWENAINFQGEILSRKLNLVNYYHSVTPLTERKIFRRVLADAGQLSKPDQILKELPGNIEALNTIINNLDKQHTLDKVVLQFTKLVAVPENNLGKSYRELNRTLDEVAKVAGMKEYLQVLEGIQKQKISRSFIDSDVIKNSFNALGHLRMDKSLNKRKNKFFDDAVLLFNQGGEKNKIRHLLVKSINESPRHADSWNYLGAIMTAENLLYEAVVFHTQAYLLDSENLETMANLADCYLRLGKKELAMNYANYLVIMNGRKKSNFVNKVINKIKRSNKL